jgi:glycosyltransferase involved in cell wall biosynthesis
VTRFSLDLFNEADRRTCRQECRIPERAPVVIFLGRVTKDKGVLDLLKAFDFIKKRGSNAHLLIVGPFDIDSGLSGDIAVADIAAIPDAHWVGYTTCPEKYLAISDLLCLPSYREGFGTSVVEAAAMAVPAIGTAIYGLSDAIEQGVTGELVVPGDASALAVVLDEILKDEPRRRKMGVAARERALRHFNAASVNQSLVDEYDQLVKSAQIERS